MDGNVAITIGFVDDHDHHYELIKCPECGYIQWAKVEHTFPWWSYVHWCTQCNYCIMESEWNKVNETKE
jgi:hypothetical protein